MQLIIDDNTATKEQLSAIAGILVANIDEVPEEVKDAITMALGLWDPYISLVKWDEGAGRIHVTYYTNSDRVECKSYIQQTVLVSGASHYHQQTQFVDTQEQAEEIATEYLKEHQVRLAPLMAEEEKRKEERLGNLRSRKTSNT